MTRIEGSEPALQFSLQADSVHPGQRGLPQSGVLPVRVLSPEKAVSFSGIGSVWLVFGKLLH